MTRTKRILSFLLVLTTLCLLCAALSATVLAGDPTEIPRVNVTTANPQAGDQIPFAGYGYTNAPQVATEHVRLVSYEWWDWTNQRKPELGETFQASLKYRLYVTVAVSDSAKYAFASTVYRYINAKNAIKNTDGVNNETTQTFYRDFLMPTGSNLICSVKAVTIVPELEVEIPRGFDHAQKPQITTANTELASYAWWDLTDNRPTDYGEIFQAEHRYRVVIKVKRTGSSVTFNPDLTSCTINEYPAKKQEEGVNNGSYLTIYYDFPKLNGPAVIQKVMTTAVEPRIGDEIPFGLDHDDKPQVTTSTAQLVSYEWWDMTDDCQTESGDTFREDHQYRLIITAERLSSKYVFSPIFTQCFVNNIGATWLSSGVNNETITFYRDFPTLLGPTRIMRVDVESVRPDPGVKIPIEGYVKENKPVVTTEHTSMRIYEWYDMNGDIVIGDTFQEGHRYRLYVMVDKVGTDYVFSDQVKAYVNGCPATFSGVQTDELIFFYYDFPLLIDSFALDGLAEPQSGQAPTYDFTLEDEANYEPDSSQDYSYGPYLETQNGATWSRWDPKEEKYTIIFNSILFEPVHTYRVTIRLKARDGYAFDPNTTAGTINGKPADVMMYPDGSCLYASVEFDLGEFVDAPAFSIPSPEAGALISSSPVSEDPGRYDRNTDSYFYYFTDGVYWYDETAGDDVLLGWETFQPGHVYTVSIRAKSIGDCRFRTADGKPDVTATINGQAAAVAASAFAKPASDLILTYTFDPCPQYEIRNVDVQIGGLLPGLPAGHEPQLPSDAPYRVVTTDPDFPGGVKWVNTATGEQLPPADDAARNQDYDAYILLESIDPEQHLFAADASEILAVVNDKSTGSVVEEIRDGGRCIVVRHRFDAVSHYYIKSLDFSFPTEGFVPRNGVEANFTFDPGSPDYHAEDYNDKGFHSGVRWMDETAFIILDPGDPFIGGHTYTCIIMAEPAADCEFVEDPEIRVDGEKAVFAGPDTGFKNFTPQRVLLKREYDVPLVVIDDVDLTVDLPRDGQTYVTLADLVYPTFSIRDAAWFDFETGEEVTSAFEADRQYTVVFTLEARIGCAFRCDKDGTPSFTAKVNGDAAVPEKLPGLDSAGFAAVRCDFTVTAELIEALEALLAPPLAGEHPSFAADHDAHLSAGAVTWTDAATGTPLGPEDVFVKEREYRAEIVLNADPGYQFRTKLAGSEPVPDVTAKLSSLEAEVRTGPGGDAKRQIVLSAAFVCTEAIRSFAVTTSGYAPGNTPADVTYTFPDGAGYGLAEAVWIEEKTDAQLADTDAFADGECYRLELRLQRTGDLRFEADFDSESGKCVPSWFTEGLADSLAAAVMSDGDNDARDRVILCAWLMPCGRTRIESIEISGVSPIQCGMTLQEYRDSLALTVPSDAPYTLDAAGVSCGEMGPDDRFGFATDSVYIYIPVTAKDSFAFWSLYDPTYHIYTPFLYVDETILVDGSESTATMSADGDGRYTLLVAARAPITATVAYDANGGSGAMASQSLPMLTQLVLPPCGFTAPSGMEFQGWRVNGAVCQPGDSVRVESNLTVAAIWQAVPVEIVSLTRSGSTFAFTLSGPVPGDAQLIFAAYGAGGRLLGAKLCTDLSTGVFSFPVPETAAVRAFVVDGECRPLGLSKAAA